MLRRMATAIRWHPRGLGTDHTPGCFLCPRSEPGMRGNIAAFVRSRADGEAIVAMFLHGARLDWREWEPTWIQVKVGACPEHLPDLERLSWQWYVGEEPLRLLTHSHLLALAEREGCKDTAIAVMYLGLWLRAVTGHADPVLGRG